jgi:ABC-type antimicrobial peptide transport system permease subunit
LASTFFAGINVGADTAAKQALDQNLSNVFVDVVVNPYYGYMGARPIGAVSSENITKAREATLNVNGVIGAEVFSDASTPAKVPGKNLSLPYVRVVGISENSRVNYGWVGGAPAIKQNETYVWAGSPDAKSLVTGDIVQLNFTVSRIENGIYVQESVVVNLTIAGSVELSDQAFAIAAGGYYGTDISSFKNYFSENLLIVSWEKTAAQLLDYFYNMSLEYFPVNPRIHVYLNREAIISPWDISGSVSKLQVITVQINTAVSPYGLQASNQLESILSTYQAAAFGMRVIFIIAALPVFFVAWYLGSTVSDVSFNLRRREIGLLLTKGFSRRQLWSMFLFEAALIGLLGGVLGISLSFTLSPWFVAAAGGQFIGVPVIGPDSIILTVVFAVIITFLSVYRPARRASNMTTVDALREYMYVEEVKPYKRLWPWVAFILGSFKMIVFLLGINFQAEMMRLSGAPTNILLFFLLGIVVAIDSILNFIGPFLFFWGFTKIFIRGSLKFQEITARAAKFLGDLGSLATKSVQRNPARAAAVAFLIALIIGYSFQVIGTLASEQDFVTREVHFSVGSDVSFTLSSPTTASKIMDTVRNNVSDIKSITAEYSFTGSAGLGTYEQGMQFRAANPSAWLSTAYYENEWFSGNSVEKAFETMSSNNHTVILDINHAKTLNKGVGDVVAVTFGDSRTGLKTEELIVAGFFGTESPQTQIPMQPYYFYSQYWSYVPEGLYDELNETIGSYASAKILIRVEGGTDSKVVDQIRELIDDLGISAGSVYSVTEQLQERQSNYTVTGTLNILRLGMIFMVVAASIGTALVTFVSLRERRREASMMSIRGLSFKQLLVMLLTENLAVVIFALLLGAVVGLIWVRGTVASNNAVNVFSYTPLSRHMVFPPDALLTLFVSFILVFSSTIIPVILMTKRYSSKLERTVREV